MDRLVIVRLDCNIQKDGEVVTFLCRHATVPGHHEGQDYVTTSAKRLAGGQLPHGPAAYHPLALIISDAPFYFNRGTPTAPALFVFRGFHYGKTAAIREENSRTTTLYFGNVPNVPLNFGTDNIYG